MYLGYVSTSEIDKVVISTKGNFKLLAFAVGKVFLVLLAVGFIVGMVLLLVFGIQNYPGVSAISCGSLAFLIFTLLNFEKLHRQEQIKIYKQRQLKEKRGAQGGHKEIGSCDC